MLLQLLSAAVLALTVEIEAPPRIDPGDLATIRAKGDATKWAWTVRGVRAAVNPDGKTARIEQFTPTPFVDSNGHQIGLALARPALVYVYLAGTNAAGEVATAVAEIRVEFETPPPPPPPPPPVPDGKYKLSAWAIVHGAKFAPADRTILAGLFRTIATEARGGKFSDPEAMIVATRDRTKSLAFDSAAFRADLAAALAPLTFTKKPLAEFAIAWDEIALGLEAAK